MNERKKQIIETAIRLFAKKGFYSTSIQEIADQSGVSKGTVYLHFQSKDELILRIFRYYFNKIRENVMRVEKGGLTAKEKFVKQLDVHFQGILEHKDFIMMLLREQAVPMNEDINRLVGQMRVETQKWYEENLVSIYGDKVEPYLYDLGLLLEGIRNGFFQLMILDNMTLSSMSIATYIVEQLDALVQGMLERKSSPLLTKEMVNPILAAFHGQEENVIEEMTHHLLEMQNIINGLALESGQEEELHSAIDFLLAEIKKPKPRTFIVKGMLANFNGMKSMKKHCERIAELLNIELL